MNIFISNLYLSRLSLEIIDLFFKGDLQNIYMKPPEDSIVHRKNHPENKTLTVDINNFRAECKSMLILENKDMFSSLFDNTNCPISFYSLCVFFQFSSSLLGSFFFFPIHLLWPCGSHRRSPAHKERQIPPFPFYFHEESVSVRVNV